MAAAIDAAVPDPFDWGKPGEAGVNDVADRQVFNPHFPPRGEDASPRRIAGGSKSIAEHLHLGQVGRGNRVLDTHAGERIVGVSAYRIDIPGMGTPIARITTISCVVVILCYVGRAIVDREIRRPAVGGE